MLPVWTVAYCGTAGPAALGWPTPIQSRVAAVMTEAIWAVSTHLAWMFDERGCGKQGGEGWCRRVGMGSGGWEG
jgi:hypothetical protein